MRDHVLLVDYILSLEYFRIFRWDASNHSLLNVRNQECKQRIQDVGLIRTYLSGLQAVLSGQLLSIAKHLLVAQTTSKWIEEDHKKRAASLELTNESCSEFAPLRLPLLQLLLLNKLEAEQSRSTYLGATAETDRNDVFNETDRVVSSLLDVRSQQGKTC